MRIKSIVPALVIASSVAVPALAKDRVGYHAIAAGSLNQAERTLETERTIFPQRPELMLNLAAVYARTGREAQARALYADVLDRDAVAMDMANGNVESSHVLAHKGLARLATTMATR